MPPVVQLILYACTIMSVGFRRRAAPLHPFFRPISPPLSLVIDEDRHSISGSARVRVRCTARSGGVLVHTELCGTHAHTVHTISVTPPLSRRATLGICPASPGAAQPPPLFPSSTPWSARAHKSNCRKVHNGVYIVEAVACIHIIVHGIPPPPARPHLSGMHLPSCLY